MEYEATGFHCNGFGIVFPGAWQECIEDMYREFTVEEIKNIARMHDIAGTHKYRKKVDNMSKIDIISGFLGAGKTTL